MRRKELGLLKGYSTPFMLLCIISTVSGQGCYTNALLQYKVGWIGGNFRQQFSLENSTASDCQLACRNSCKCAQFIWWGDQGVADSVAVCSLYDRTKLSAGSGNGGWLIGNRSLDAEACDGLLSTYTEYPKMSVSAVDIETLRENVTLESCRAACNAVCDCAAFTISTDGEGNTVCGLKNDASDQTPEKTTSLWIRDGKCKDWSNVYTHYSGKDAPGNDIASRILSNVDDCRAFCNSNCECIAFNFYLAVDKNRYCHLKNSTSTLKDLGTIDFYVRQPGIPQPPPPPPLSSPHPPPPRLSPAPSPQGLPRPSTPGPLPDLAPAPIDAAAPSNESALQEPSKSTALIVGGAVGGGALLAFLVAAAFCLFIKRRRHTPMRPPSAIFDGLKVYTYEELRTATSDFRDVLGGGGSAEVFRAELEDRVVAVKRLKESEDQKTSDQEFTAEARGLGVLLHVNLVRLLGYSNDPNRPKMLVYEFIHGGTLESLLYGGKNGVPPPVPLSFDRRMAIALGIARGVEYCHHSIETTLIHRDIKPANILMTTRGERAVPKVADFGLARLLDTSDQGMSTVVLDMKPGQPQPAAAPGLQLPDGVSNSTASVSTPHGTSSASASSSSGPVGLGRGSSMAHMQGAQFTSVAGTMGYIDPEYFQTSRPTRKSDVYSFGVVLLELIMGLRPMRIYEHLLATVGSAALNSQTGITETEAMCTYEAMLRQLLQQGESAVHAMVASTLDQEGLDSHRTFQAMRIAQECLQGKGKMRPSMRKVVRMLEQLMEGETKS